MSEILAFSESADSDPKLSTEPVSESGDIHTATDVPPKEAPLKQKPFHLRKKRILTRIFHRKISNLLTIPKKIRLPEKRKVSTTTFSIQQKN